MGARRLGRGQELGTGSLTQLRRGRRRAATVGIESAFDKADLRRLEEIKAAYDPDDFFRLNNDIPPATYAG